MNPKTGYDSWYSRTPVGDSISLLDYYAGQALTALLTLPNYNAMPADKLAAHAYGYATAMVNEKKVRGVDE